MRSITDHLKRIRKEAVQNDFITFVWLLYSILLIIFFVGIGYEAIFYLSSSIRLFILKTLLISGLLIILFVFIINVLIEQNKIKPEKLFYSGMINISWEEAKEKYLGEVGR